MQILTVIQGPDRGKRFELPANEPQLIGRSSEALPISDDTVSRRHAELTPDGDEWFIRDLDSQNGTYLNGTRLRGRRQLRPGDQIRTGSTLLVFGKATLSESEDVIRFAGPGEIDFGIEHAIPSNDDSVILAEPEPGAAALDHLRVIYRLTALTGRLLDRTELLEAVMDLVFQEFKPERGYMVLRDDDRLEPVVARHRSPGADNDAAISKTILQHVLSRSEGVLSSNAMSDSRFAAGDSVQAYGIRSAICSPIRFRDRVFGVVYIDSSVANYTFTEQQLALMNAIGQHTGLALANAELAGQRLHTERLAAIGETVASLSHSIKNILQGLRGGADVVEMGLKRQNLELSSDGWQILKRNLDRIVGLTLNMLAFSRQRTVEVELQPLHGVIDDCVQLLEGLAGQKNVALIADYDPEMPPIPLDSSLIHQAMMNLITNAIEAVESETGAVTVRTMFREADPLLGHGGTYADIQIIDNGPGIPQDRQRWIFEPFRTTKGTRGTGLGLAVTKRIIEEHRGSIRVESTPQDGTTFTLVLPADTGDPSATTDSVVDRKPGSDELLSS
ncbi:MAG: ATP-binding protein [Planctomycetota bacterium]